MPLRLTAILTLTLAGTSVAQSTQGTVYTLFDPAFAYAVSAHQADSRVGSVGTINKLDGQTVAQTSAACDGSGDAMRCALRFVYAFTRSDDPGEFVGVSFGFGRATVPTVTTTGARGPDHSSDEFFDLTRLMRSASEANVSIESIRLVLVPTHAGSILSLKIELKDSLGRVASKRIALDATSSIAAKTFSFPLSEFSGVDTTKAREFNIVVEEAPDGAVNPSSGGFAVERIEMVDETGPRLDVGYVRTLGDRDFLRALALREFETLLRLRDAHTGASLDRTLRRDLIHWGATGWFLSALPGAVRMGWISSDDARDAGRTILRFLDDETLWCNEPTGCVGNSLGMLYRFGGIDPTGLREKRTGTRKINENNVNAVEASTIETALLQFGAATFAEGFKSDAEIQSRVLALLRRTKWRELIDAGTGQFFLGWKPQIQTNGPYFATPAATGGFWSSKDGTGTPLTIDFSTDEGAMAAILAAGSAQSGTGPDPWYRMTRNRGTDQCAGVVVTFPGAWFTYSFLSATYMNPDEWQDLGDESGTVTVDWRRNAIDVFEALRAMSPPGEIVLPDAIELPDKMYKAQGRPQCAIDKAPSFTGTRSPYSLELAVGLGGATATAAIAELKRLMTVRPEIWDPLFGLLDSFHPDLSQFLPFSSSPLIRSEGRWVQQQVWPLNKGAALLALLNYLDDGFIWRTANEHEVVKRGRSVIDPRPRVSLQSTSLHFGAIVSGSGALFVQQTPPQAVRLSQTGLGAVTWNATASQPWITVSPQFGTGSATLTVGVTPMTGLPASGFSGGFVELSFTGAGTTAGPINVTLNTTSSGAVPVGAFDTPADGTTGVTGSIGVTGWAMDDIEVTGVRILRDPVAGEPAGTLVLIGHAVLVDGARPDVQALFPNSPRNSRAGWGYLMLTNFLPGLGNGTFRLTAIADDADGHSTILGTKTITCNNSSATTPTGAIDTPAQGGTVSGTNVTNFGWVLSPNPRRADPPGGGTVQIVINGAFISGVPSGWTSRSDLTALFPASEYPGIGTALGVAGFDSTALANGVHTISWLVTDNLGAASGIGSRYFTVSNGSLVLDSDSFRLKAEARLSGTELSRLPPSGGSIIGRRGFDIETPLRSHPVRNGVATIQSEELDRIELQLAGADRSTDRGESTFTGYLRVAGGLAPLPIGSALNASTGEFTWAPGVGFVGPYDLVFARWEHGRAVARQDVRVVLNAKGSNRVGPQVVIDTPSSRADVAQPFVVAGWALHKSEAARTGVDTLHVWAYPVTGGDPIFAGVAAYGVARPDVAALFGDRFGRSGFGLTVDGLPPGTYDLAVFAWSTVDNRFLPAKVVRVTVR